MPWIPKSKLWDPVIERIHKKSTFRKGKYLSLGGQVALIKSVLASMPIYIFVLLQMSFCNREELRKNRRDFLWNDSVEKRKYHLVGWDKVSTRMTSREKTIIW